MDGMFIVDDARSPFTRAHEGALAGVDADGQIREGGALEKPGGLKPAFREDGGAGALGELRQTSRSPAAGPSMAKRRERGVRLPQE